MSSIVTHNAPKAFGFPDSYINEAARGFLNRRKEQSWKNLPSEDLEKLRMTIKQRAEERAVKEGKRPPIQHTKPAWMKRKVTVYGPEEHQ